jgi:hypothetical protein
LYVFGEWESLQRREASRKLSKLDWRKQDRSNEWLKEIRASLARAMIILEKAM